MKFYRPKGKVQADFIPGPFSTADYATNNEGAAPQFPDGAYHAIIDGVAQYIGKAEFEEKFEPTKIKAKTQPATTPSTPAPRRRATGGNREQAN